MPTVYTERMIIVVTEADADIANVHAKAVDLIGGEYTFTARLSPTGEMPPTHRWCNWAMTPAERADMSNRLDNLIRLGRVKAYDALTVTPDQVLADLGLQPINLRP